MHTYAYIICIDSKSSPERLIPQVLSNNLLVQENQTFTVQLHSTGSFWPFLAKTYTPMSQGNLFSIAV